MKNKQLPVDDVKSHWTTFWCLCFWCLKCAIETFFNSHLTVSICLMKTEFLRISLLLYIAFVVPSELFHPRGTHSVWCNGIKKENALESARHRKAASAKSNKNSPRSIKEQTKASKMTKLLEWSRGASLIAHYRVSHVCLLIVNIPMAGRVWETKPETKHSSPRHNEKQWGKAQCKEVWPLVVRGSLWVVTPSLPSNSPVWKAPSVHLGSTLECWKVSQLLLYCFEICVGKNLLFLLHHFWPETTKKKQF